MTPFNGIEAAKRIRRVSPATGIIAVTISNHIVHAKQMLQLGVPGYVTKNSSVEEMQEAIVAVSKGNQYICTEMKELLSDSIESFDTDSSIQSLTGRELQIIKLIKDGNSSREISVALDISIKTVEVHRYNILKKLHVKNAVALIQFMDESAVRI
jgi:DNA-binding NarL/FixJ family response regulator